MVNWEELEKVGISKASLEQQGLLDSMLKGYKTNKLVPLTIHLSGLLTAKLDARLSLIPQQDGQVGLAIHGIRKEPQLERPYFGFNFSEEDKKNLRETGNMGRAVELNLRGSEYTPCLISIDKNTNELVAVRQEHVYIPQEVSGVRLTDEEIRLLKEGQPVKVEGMTSKTGKEFDATLQYSAERRGAGVHLPEEPGIQREIHRGRTALTHPDKDAQRGTYHPGRGHEVQEQGRGFLRVCHDRPDDRTAELHPS
ncbi:DUF3945 domain-containing protein [Phocaeicola dorei]|nr:DUF3945 domain-containing protein [Phocaeicola dorei]